MMKISACNQFAGTISEVHTGAVYTEVEVRLRGETALVKASQRLILVDFGGYRISARNQFAGQYRAGEASARLTPRSRSN